MKEGKWVRTGTSRFRSKLAPFTTILCCRSSKRQVVLKKVTHQKPLGEIFKFQSPHRCRRAAAMLQREHIFQLLFFQLQCVPEIMECMTAISRHGCHYRCHYCDNWTGRYRAKSCSLAHKARNRNVGYSPIFISIFSIFSAYMPMDNADIT